MKGTIAVSVGVCWFLYAKFISVRKFLDSDVVAAVLAGRQDDGVGIAGSQPTAENFRCITVLDVNFSYVC